jgi:hypothetical protein
MNPIILKLEMDGPLTTGYRFERDGQKVDDMDALVEGYRVEDQAAQILFATVQGIVLQHRRVRAQQSLSA